MHTDDWFFHQHRLKGLSFLHFLLHLCQQSEGRLCVLNSGTRDCARPRTVSQLVSFCKNSAGIRTERAGRGQTDPAELPLGTRAGFSTAAPQHLALRSVQTCVCFPGFIPEHFVCGAVVNGAVLLVWGSNCTLLGVFYTTMPYTVIGALLALLHRGCLSFLVSCCTALSI